MCYNFSIKGLEVDVMGITEIKNEIAALDKLMYNVVSGHDTGILSDSAFAEIFWKIVDKRAELVKQVAAINSK